MTDALALIIVATCVLALLYVAENHGRRIDALERRAAVTMEGK